MNVLRRLKKFVLHLLTKKSELVRLLENPSIFDVIVALRRSIFLHIIENPSIFDVPSMHHTIIQKKLQRPTQRIARSQSYDSGISTAKDFDIAENIVSVNLSFCLHAIKIINMAILKISELQKECYQASSEYHVSSLNKLWVVMKPNSTRTGGMLTAEWGELGFQGNDPSSDFRGMGMLGLVQLIYFGENYFDNAQHILQGSNHKRRYIPYAATSMTMTAFVLELLHTRKLHKRLFLRLESCRPQLLSLFNGGVISTNQSASIDLINSDRVDIPCRDILISEVHEVFCDVYSGFFDLWESRDPPDIRSFQKIFTEFKNTFSSKYHAI